MAQINLRSLISTQSGVGATTGKEAAQIVNDNNKVIKENLEAIWDILELMVGSPNVEGIRVRPVQDPDNPEEVLYNYFEYNTDGDFEEGEWLPIPVLFESLVGDIRQNSQLKNLVDSLTPLDRFLKVETQVGVNTSNISQNRADIEKLQESEAEQDVQLEELENLTAQHEHSLRTKANQVLELFDIVAKGSGYATGTTIMDQAGNSVLTILSVDENGGVLNVELSDQTEANSYYIQILDGGKDYRVGDIIPTDNQMYNALVTMIDVNGSILRAELTNEKSGEYIGQGANLHLTQGEGAIVSMTTYPTLYFICTNDGQHNRIQYFLNGDLTTPYDIIAYPDFVNIQKIISDETDSYYDLTYHADSEFAIDYELGDTFSIDGLEFTGQITDISTVPYTVSCNIPTTYPENLAGEYTTTATSGSGTGLHILINSLFHPQRTTNAEFNQYMDNHDEYLQDIVENAVTEAVDMLTAMIKLKADQVDLEAHLNDFGNPHGVTKEQIGLGQVDDTSDLDKPVSTAVQEELNYINKRIDNIKQTRVVSNAYYTYLADTRTIDPDIIYMIGNENSTFVNEISLKEDGIASPYVSGEICRVEGTSWQITIIDANESPMLFVDDIDDYSELDISGDYLLSSINGTGEGLMVHIERIQY